MKTTKKLYLIDGMNMVFRHFFALGRAQLTTSKKLPVSAILGSSLFLNRLIREEKPDFLAVAMDTPEPTFRHIKYPDYKANREQIDDELSVQIPYIYELISSIGCPIIKKPGFEADDIIGSLCAQLTKIEKDLRIYIVSGDKDYCQLVSKNIFLYQPKKNESAQILGPKEVQDKFSCPPSKITDCLSIIGDPSDNISGVSGIGIKTAGKLISEFGSLENIYKSIDKVQSKSQKEKLIRDKKKAFKAKELVTIKKDLNLNLKIKDLECHIKESLTNSKILNFYKKLEFKNLYEKALSYKEDTKITKDIQTTPKKVLIKKPSNKTLSKGFCFYFVEKNNNSYIELQELLEKSPSQKFMIQNINNKEINYLKKIFNSKQQKIGCNIKKHMHIFNTFSFPLDISKPYDDIKLMDYLKSPGSRQHDLEDCQKRYLNMTEEDSKTSPTEDIYKIYQKMIDKKDTKTTKIYSDIEVPLIKILFEIEKKGVFIDQSYFIELSKSINKDIQKISEEIFKIAGETFNLNSPKQMRNILYEKMQLQNTLKSQTIQSKKTGLSTNESSLKKLEHHEISKKILTYRELSKLKNTYLDVLPKFINNKTSRIHTSLKQTVTATGRLSSDTPNLQNIPTRSKWGAEIRKAFRAQNTNDIIIAADYSQIELRVLAHFIPESSFASALARGDDIHTQTAAKIFNKAPIAITQAERGQAKAINFGIIYGMGAKKLAEEIKVSTVKARKFIDTYFKFYPEIKALMDLLKKTAFEQGYTQTLFGRKRYFSDMPLKGSHLENIAFNSPIQGSAADIIKMAMINLSKRLKENRFKTKMILQIHDELLFEGPANEREKVSQIIRKTMEHAGSLKVPLQVDIGWGDSWFAAKNKKT